MKWFNRRLSEAENNVPEWCSIFIVNQWYKMERVEMLFQFFVSKRLVDFSMDH